MESVIHIGAARGEIDFYEEIGCKNLTYVEPDKTCLLVLKENALKHFKNESRSINNLKIIEKACSTKGGLKVNFYANGCGQSSLEKPGKRRLAEMIGEEKAKFEEYEVETTTLREVYSESFKCSRQIDYLCIDTQGHEKNILLSTPSKFLSDFFSIIDVELMTDSTQYDINDHDWKLVVAHLLNSGFTPLVYPQRITESYIFLNTRHRKWIESVARPITESIARLLAKRVIKLEGMESSHHIDCHLGSLGDKSFHPLGIAGGAITSNQIHVFRKEFIRRASLIQPAKFDLITC